MSTAEIGTEIERELGRKIEYSEFVKESSAIGELVTEILEARKNQDKLGNKNFGLEGYGTNYGAYKFQNPNTKESFIESGHSTGMGGTPNTHPDQKVLEKMIKKAITKNWFQIKQDNLKKNTYDPSFYKKELGSIKITFFSERSPCHPRGCKEYLSEILTSHENHKIYYAVQCGTSSKEDLKAELSLAVSIFIQKKRRISPSDDELYKTPTKQHSQKQPPTNPPQQDSYLEEDEPLPKTPPAPPKKPRTFSELESDEETPLASSSATSKATHAAPRTPAALLKAGLTAVSTNLAVLSASGPSAPNQPASPLTPGFFAAHAQTVPAPQPTTPTAPAEPEEQQPGAAPQPAESQPPAVGAQPPRRGNEGKKLGGRR